MPKCCELLSSARTACRSPLCRRQTGECEPRGCLFPIAPNCPPNLSPPNRKGVDMRKLAIAMAWVAALVIAAILAWNAEATTLTSAAAFHSETNHSLVEKAGCWLPGLPGECEIGQQKVCDRFHKRGCRCEPCPGWYPWRGSKPAH